MKSATREYLAEIARKKAMLPFHGDIQDSLSNIKPLIDLFPKWNTADADRMWCAAFVYYCCVEAGFEIPCSPDECVTCSLAGCGGWEEFAMGNESIEYHRDKDGFQPLPGDIVLYDNTFIGHEHDHIGIVLAADDNSITAAEGNIGSTNMSGIITRKRDAHIRAFIRIPNHYHY